MYTSAYTKRKLPELAKIFDSSPGGFNTKCEDSQNKNASKINSSNKNSPSAHLKFETKSDNLILKEELAQTLSFTSVTASPHDLKYLNKRLKEAHHAWGFY
jgi:hypothetical protein